MEGGKEKNEGGKSMNAAALSRKMSTAGCERRFVFLAVISLQSGKEHYNCLPRHVTQQLELLVATQHVHGKAHQGTSV